MDWKGKNKQGRMFKLCSHQMGLYFLCPQLPTVGQQKTIITLIHKGKKPPTEKSIKLETSNTPPTQTIKS